MKRTTKTALVGLASFILIYIAIFLIPLLIQSNMMDLAVGLLTALPISLALVYINIKFGSVSTTHHMGIRFFSLASALVYTFIGSVMYILSAHGTLNRLLLFIPVDIAILAIPVYLLYRIGKPSPLNPEDFSGEYTERLHSLVGDASADNHEVYISRKKAARSYAETSNGRAWHVLLKQDAIQQLDPGEIDAAMLEAYYSRKFGLTKKILLLGDIYVIISVDLLLIGFLLVTLLGIAYSLSLLIISAAGVVMIAAFPFFLRFLLWRIQSRADREVLKHLSATDSFISAIRKKSFLMLPLRPLTPKQQIRYEKRLGRIIDRRIKVIRKLGADSGKR